MIFPTPYQVDVIVVPIFVDEEIELREIKECVQDHMAIKWQKEDMSSI